MPLQLDPLQPVAGSVARGAQLGRDIFAPTETQKFEVEKQKVDILGRQATTARNAAVQKKKEADFKMLGDAADATGDPELELQLRKKQMGIVFDQSPDSFDITIPTKDFLKKISDLTLNINKKGVTPTTQGKLVALTFESTNMVGLEDHPLWIQLAEAQKAASGVATAGATAGAQAEARLPSERDRERFETDEAIRLAREKAEFARETARQKPTEKTLVEKEVDAWRTAQQAGDTVKTAALAASIAKRATDQNFMVMTDPATGKVMVGTGASVTQALTQSRITDAQASVSNADTALDILSMLENELSETNLGIRGFVKGTAQDLIATFGANSAVANRLQGMEDRALDIIRGEPEISQEVKNWAFDPSNQAVLTYKTQAAIIMARTMEESSRGLTDRDVKLQLDALGTQGTFTTPPKAKAGIAANRKIISRIRGRSLEALKNIKSPTNPITKAMNEASGTQGIQPPVPLDDAARLREAFISWPEPVQEAFLKFQRARQGQR